MVRCLIVLALLAIPAVTPAAELEGEVRLVAGGMVVVQSPAGTEVVGLERGAALTGFQSLRGLHGGDRVRVTWGREPAGVKLATTLAVDPPVACADPELWITPVELAGLVGPDGRAGGAVVVDVRPPEAFAAGHLPGAGLGETEAEQDLPLVFYCDDARCSSSLTAVRAALEAGRGRVRALRGGLNAWVGDGGFTEMAPRHLAAALAAGERLLVVDARENGRETIPGAVHIPVSAMRWQLFAGEAWMPPLVFVGADATDDAPVAAARKTIAWRYSHEDLPWVPVHVLAGGVAGWTAVGEPTSALAEASTTFGYSPDPSRGEISRAEFDELWARRGGGAVLLDVRGPLVHPPDWVLHIPLEELPHLVTELPPDRPIVAFCDLGYRSGIAWQILAPLGYQVRFLNASPELDRVE